MCFPPFRNLIPFNTDGAPDSSTRIKDAGIAIRHSRGRILFYTAGSRNGLEGMETVCPQGSRRRPGTHKKKLYLRKRHFFVIEKYVEDVKQDEKGVPDLVESIMRPTDPVKEELRRILSQMIQFKPEIHKIRVCTFEMS